MQRKPRSTLHFGIVLYRSLRLRVARQLLSVASPDTVLRNLPSGAPFSASGFLRNFFKRLRGSVHPGIRSAKLPKVMERMGANCLRMNELEGIQEGSQRSVMADCPRPLAERWVSARRSIALAKPHLELSHFGEIKVTNFHCRHDHVKRLFSAGTKRHTHGFNIREHMNQAFVENGSCEFPA